MLLAILLGLLAAPSSRAEEPAYTLEIPTLDVPFNFNQGLRFPSMAQSLALSNDLYLVGHEALERWLEERPPLGRKVAILGFDLITFWLPLGNAWLHEEWHRAVLSRRAISSFNDVYRFKLLSEVIAVSHVRDEDLVRLKREHPAEQVRLSSAGMEAQFEQSLALEKSSFFGDSRAWHGSLLWLNKVNNISYLFSCAGDSADELTSRMNSDDGADIEARDFTGLDCIAWAYDLYRPFEPYEARGVHPSGAGIDRYRKLSDLTSEERDYLEAQAVLSLLNLLDPFLYGVRELGNEPRWTLLLRHELAPFGTSLGLHLLTQQSPWNLAFSARAYFSGTRTSPGLEAELIRYPLGSLSLGGRINLWLQPKHLLFRSTELAPGALLSARLGWPLGEHWQAFVEAEAKSAGWVAGQAYLDRSFSLRTGASFQVD